MPESPGKPPKRGRPRKKASDLRTDEVLKKLFPTKAVEAAKEEVKKADESSK
jgi:hypothetical protein